MVENQGWGLLMWPQPDLENHEDPIEYARFDFRNPKACRIMWSLSGLRPVVLIHPFLFLSNHLVWFHPRRQPTPYINLPPTSFIPSCPHPVYSQDMASMHQNFDDNDTSSDSDSDCALPEYVLTSIAKRRRLNKSTDQESSSKCPEGGLP